MTSYLIASTAEDAVLKPLKAYKSDLHHFEAFLKGCKLRITQVVPRTMNEYIAHMQAGPNPRFGKVGLSDATIARRVAAVSSYFQYLRVARNARLANPATAIRRRWKSNRQPKAVPEKTLEELLEGTASLRDRAILSLFLSTGLRLSELSPLNRDSIQIRMEMKDGDRTFSGSGEVLGKGSKVRTFFVDGQTLEVLGAYLRSRTDSHPALFLSQRGKRMSGRAIQQMIATRCRVLGIEHIHPHQLRHCFAHRLANADIDLRILSGLMGHANPSTTQIYFQLTDKTLARGYFSAMEFRDAR